MNPKYKAILCIVFSAFCFALMNTFVRLAGDVPSIEKSFFRNSVAFLMAAVILLRKKEGFKPTKGCFPALLVRSFCGTVGVLCNFYAVDHLVLADASMLNKMSPFFAIIASIFILKEKLTLPQVGGVAAAFVGSMLIVKPTLTNVDLGPALIGLLGGLGAGVAYSVVRHLSIKGERSAYIVFFFSGFSTLVVVPWILFNFQPMTGQQLALLLCAGVTAAAGQLGITAAYSYAPAREVSVYDYTQVIFAALLGWFLFGQTPDVFSLVGYVVICGAAVAMFLYNNRLHRSGE